MIGLVGEPVETSFRTETDATIMNRYAMLLSLFLWYSDWILSSERRQFHSSPSKLVCRPRVNVFAFFFMPIHVP